MTEVSDNSEIIDTDKNESNETLSNHFGIMPLWCEILGFCCGVAEVINFLGYYAIG